MAFSGERRAFSCVVEMILLYFRQIPTDVFANRQSAVGFDAGLVAKSANGGVQAIISQLLFREYKPVVSLFQFKRIENVFKANRGANSIRNLAALKEVFVNTSVQSHIFRELLLVQTVKEFEEGQEVAFSRSVRTYQYIDG